MTLTEHDSNGSKTTCVNPEGMAVNGSQRQCGMAVGNDGVGPWLGPKPHSYPGGAHFKTQRGRGGYLIDITVGI